jgi:hypothetical protein
METNHKEGAMLQTESNTGKVERNILTAAQEFLGHKNLIADFEHGQWWLTNKKTGEQWSVVDSNSPSGFDFEQVTGPDEDEN